MAEKAFKFEIFKNHWRDSWFIHRAAISVKHEIGLVLFSSNLFDQTCGFVCWKRLKTKKVPILMGFAIKTENNLKQN